FYATGEGYQVWGGLFSCCYEGPLQLQAEEVSEVHWMSLAEIAARTSEFTPDSLLAIATWQARR
ncbi:MAG: NUDIX hydrolase YfcD, partial [Aeromonas sp.]